jgi:hypothetical protein
MDRRAYLKAIWVRYNSAPRTAKKPIFDEFCAVCGYSRKYAIVLLNKPLLRAAGPVCKPMLFGGFGQDLGSLGLHVLPQAQGYYPGMAAALRAGVQARGR